MTDERAMQRMSIYGVSFDMVGKQPIVLLRTEDGKRFLPIWIGQAEASAIMSRIEGAVPPRPMTHDLLAAIIGELGGTVERVAITELRENTYYALVTLTSGGRQLEIDSRTSDALALAVRAEAPIYAADTVIEESGVEFEDDSAPGDQEVVEEFRRFLADVRPEDFRIDG